MSQTRDTDRVLGRIERCQRGIDQPATIEVTATSPERAAIYLNGVLMGEGSLPPITLPAGEYHLAYTAMDHHPSEESVTLAAGETHALSAELTMLTFYGQLSVESSIEGASVLLDGRLCASHQRAAGARDGALPHRGRRSRPPPWRRRVEVRREGHAYVDAASTRPSTSRFSATAPPRARSLVRRLVLFRDDDVELPGGRVEGILPVHPTPEVCELARQAAERECRAALGPGAFGHRDRRAARRARDRAHALAEGLSTVPLPVMTGIGVSASVSAIGGTSVILLTKKNSSSSLT